MFIKKCDYANKNRFRNAKIAISKVNFDFSGFFTSKNELKTAF